MLRTDVLQTVKHSLDVIKKPKNPLHSVFVSAKICDTQRLMYPTSCNVCRCCYNKCFYLYDCYLGRLGEVVA